MCPPYFSMLGGVVTRCFYLDVIELVEKHQFALSDLGFVTWRHVSISAIRQEGNELNCSVSIIRRYGNKHHLSSTVKLSNLPAERELNPTVAPPSRHPCWGLGRPLDGGRSLQDR